MRELLSGAVNIIENLIGRTGIVCNIAAGRPPGFPKSLPVGKEVIHYGGEISRTAYFHATAVGDERTGFAELSVVGTYYHGATVNRRFRNIVNADAEASAYISHCGIAVKTRQQSVAVDDETVGRGYRFRSLASISCK